MLKMSEKRNRQRSEKQQRAQSQPTKKRRELPVAYSGVSTVSGVNEFERGLYDTRVRIRARRRDLSLQVLYKFSENMIKPNPNSKSEVYKKNTKSSRKFPLGGNKHKIRSLQKSSKQQNRLRKFPLEGSKHRTRSSFFESLQKISAGKQVQVQACIGHNMPLPVFHSVLVI
jgi:hypothetical protein